MKNYPEAYSYYKEAADLDISEPEYRYHMAKCCEFLNDTENAISCYSLLKRIAPLNIVYLEEYAKFLYKINKKKTAIELVKSVLKNVSQEEKNRLKNLLNTFK